MADKIKCKEKDCEGTLDKDNPFRLQTGCRSSMICFPCSKCGRIHNCNGDTMSNRSGGRVYLKDGELKII